MRHLYFNICLILFCLIVFQVHAHAPDAELANMTYMIGDENHSQKVTLLEGKYRYPDEHPLLCVYYEGEFIYGDFNKDELLDAAVIIRDSGGGSGYSTNLAFLINDGTELVHKSSYDLGYRPGIIFLNEKEGKVIVDMYVNDKDTRVEGIRKREQVVFEYAGPTSWGTDLGYPMRSPEDKS
ncbi:hypothetical protein ACFL0T_00770 [Candidatus Omnitrophota bacterium]